jgi:hypothetical protein
MIRQQQLLGGVDSLTTDLFVAAFPGTEAGLENVEVTQ